MGKVYVYIVLGLTIIFGQGCVGEISSMQDGKRSSFVYSSALPAQDQLLVHYTFDNIDGDTLLDSSSSGNHGKLVGPATRETGRVGQALKVNGDSYAILTNAVGLPSGGESRSLAFWVKADGIIPGKVMAGYGTESRCQNFQVGTDLDTGKNLSFYGWAECDFETDFPIAMLMDGDFHHIALTYDGSKVALYIDGELVGASNQSLETATRTLCIGGEVAGNQCDRLFQGSIDDFRVYGKALNPSEVAAFMAPVGDPSLIVHYEFEEEGTQVLDSSIYQNDAIVEGDLNRVPGVRGLGLSFSGNSYAVAQNIGSLPIGNKPRTMSFWVKTTSSQAATVIAGYGNTKVCENFQSGFDLQDGESLSLYGWSDCDYQSSIASNIIADGKFHHLAYAYDGDVLRIYVDGQLLDSVQRNLQTVATTLCLGGEVNGTSCDRLFEGVIDEFKIYDRSLSSAEVGELQNESPIYEEPVTSEVRVSLSTASGTALSGMSGLPPGTITLNQDIADDDYVVIEAQLLESAMASVTFSQNGNLIHTENGAPYEHRIGGATAPNSYIKVESDKTTEFTVRFYTENNGGGDLVAEATYQIHFMGNSENPSDGNDDGGTNEPAPVESGSNRTYDMKYAEQFGSQNLTFKRFASSKLCKVLKDRSNQYKDLSKFEITVDGIKYPVINAPKRFAISRNSGNQQSALQDAFNKINRNFTNSEGLNGSGNPVIYFPRYGSNDVYSYNNKLLLPNSNVILCGSGVTLASTDTQNVAFAVGNSNNVHIVDFRLIGRDDTISTWPERFFARNKEDAGKEGTDISLKSSYAARVRCVGCKGLVIAGNYMLGGRGGVRTYGADGVYVYDNHVERTQSDGIHLVSGTRNMVVANNRLINVGDDCISFVAYNAPHQSGHANDSPSNALVEGNDCWGGRGRGLTVIGGFHVTHRGNHIKDQKANCSLFFPSDNHSKTDVGSFLASQNLYENCFHQTKTIGYPYRGGVGFMGHNGNFVRDGVLYKNIVLRTLSAGDGHFRFKHTEYIRNLRFEGNRTYGNKPQFFGAPSGNGMVYTENIHSTNSNPEIDRSKYGSTLTTQPSKPYVFPE